jgi:hypothetical protein
VSVVGRLKTSHFIIFFYSEAKMKLPWDDALIDEYVDRVCNKGETHHNLNVIFPNIKQVIQKCVSEFEQSMNQLTKYQETIDDFYNDMYYTCKQIKQNIERARRKFITEVQTLPLDALSRKVTVHIKPRLKFIANSVGNITIAPISKSIITDYKHNNRTLTYTDMHIPEQAKHLCKSYVDSGIFESTGVIYIYYKQCLILYTESFEYILHVDIQSDFGICISFKEHFGIYTHTSLLMFNSYAQLLWIHNVDPINTAIVTKNDFFQPNTLCISLNTKSIHVSHSLLSGEFFLFISPPCKTTYNQNNLSASLLTPNFTDKTLVWTENWYRYKIIYSNNKLDFYHAWGVIFDPNDVNSIPTLKHSLLVEENPLFNMHLSPHNAVVLICCNNKFSVL